MKPGKTLLTRLLREGYQRFFRASAILYPPTILYFTHWVPRDQVAPYLLVRALLGVGVCYLGWTRRALPISAMRSITLLFIASAMIGNIQLVDFGGPNLITVLVHAGHLLFGFLEVETGWSLLMSVLLSLIWHFTARAAGGSGDFASSGLAFSLGIGLYIVVTRGASMRRMLRLSLDQDEVNRQMESALELVDAFNLELEQRVQERRLELGHAKTRLTAAYAELQASHQQQSQLQADWLQARRLEMLGRFASGLSHSFSNTVTSIWLGLHQLETPAEVFSSPTCLADIDTACDKSASICRRLLMSCGSHAVVDRPFEVNRQVQESLSLLRRAVPNPIQFTSESQAIFVLGDPSLLDQILLNLVLNAAGASLPEQTIEVTVEATGGCKLSVKDYGSGIEPDTLERIFEPFFTTRADGQGHGLGLAIVTGAVERLHGSCTVASKPWEGTEFTVQLPPFAEEEQTQPEVRPAPAMAPPPLVRICLVEDQDALRKLVNNYLVKHSHQVSAFASAEEACLSDSVFDLLVTDISLPGRNGVDLAQQMAEQNPDLRVIFMSGYPFDAESVKIESKRWIFLPKPFRLSEFSQQLTLLLGS